MEVGITLMLGYVGFSFILVLIASQFSADESIIFGVIKLLFLFGALFILLTGSSSLTEFIVADNSTNSTAAFEGQSNAAYSSLIWVLYSFVSLFGIYILYKAFEFMRGVKLK